MDDRFTIDLEARSFAGLRAVPDFNGTTGSDVNAVIQAALAQCSGSASAAGGRVILGEGDYYAPNGIDWRKVGVLEGQGGDPFGRYGTRIWVPANKSGIVCHGYFSAGSTGARSENSRISGIHFASLHNSNLKSGGAAIGLLNPKFRPSTALALGDIVGPSHYPKLTIPSFPAGIHVDFGRAWQVVARAGAGLTGAAEPSWHWHESAGAANITAIAVAGGAANPCQVTCLDPLNGDGHGYATGEQVTIENVTGSVGAAINGTHTVTVISASVFSIPVDTTGLVWSGGGTIRRPDIVSGDITFRMIQAHGIEARDSKIEIDHCTFSGFPGLAIRNRTGVGGEPAASANFMRVRNTSIYQCSSGVGIYGGDSNGCVLESIDVHFCPAYGYNDHGVISNVYENCTADVCENGTFAGSNLQINGKYVEAAPGASILYGHSRVTGTGLGRPGFPARPGVTPVNFTLEGASMCWSDPDPTKRPLSWAEAAAYTGAGPAGTLTAGMIVRPTVDTGYVYSVDIGGLLGAEPTWPLGYDWHAGASNNKTVTSGTVTFSAACATTLSTFVRDQDQDFNSGRRVIMLFAATKLYFDCGFKDNSYPNSIFGFGALDSSIDGAQKWTFRWNSTLQGFYFNRAELGDGYALGVRAGSQPKADAPNGIYVGGILITVGTAAPVTGGTKGDMHINSNSGVGGVDHWRCTTTGGPGVAVWTAHNL